MLNDNKEFLNYGKYGIMRLNYLKENKPVLYTSLVSSGELSQHLLDVNQRASLEVKQLVASFVKDIELPDRSSSSEAWAQEMNSLKHRAEEIVCSKLIFV